MAIAFAPFGPSVTIVVTTSASVPFRPGALGDRQSSAYRIVNMGTVPVFLTWGSQATLAAPPVVGVQTTGLWLQPNSIEVLTFAPDAYFSAITTSGSANLSMSIGDGL